MMYSEDEYLMISGIQHYVFCPRQWALIHIEQQWAENSRTIEGEYMHKNAHDGKLHEKRGNIIITRALPVSSPYLGVSGECDVVEFHLSDKGVNIFGYEGKYIPVPIEYKRGSAKADDSDILQLTAQAMCIENMLCCTIPTGYIFYGETRHRFRVDFTEELKNKAESIINEMHRLYKRAYTPKCKRTKACNACSLKNICLPVLLGNKSGKKYIEEMLKEGE